MRFGKKKERPQVIPEGQLSFADFKGKEVRRVLHDNEWYFSVVDVLEAISESALPSQDWNDLKTKLVEEEGYEDLTESIETLKMQSADGQDIDTDAANVETLFRIIQSIPLKKTEVVKRWLAKVGYERVLEHQNPDIAIKRAILEYKQRGRTDEWIEARISCTLTRQSLTDEWGRRGIQGQQYGILTNLIHEKTFDISIKQHENFKGLKKQNLRDHMTSTELLFTRLGEASTKDIAVAKNARGFLQNQAAAQEGGQIAGNARKALEEQTGKNVISSSNFLQNKESSKELPSS